MSLGQSVLKHIHMHVPPQTHPYNLTQNWGMQSALNLHLEIRALHSLHDQALSNSTGFPVFVLSSGKYTFT